MPKTLKLISLGARGVGKTVFLVSNCANTLQEPKADSQQSLWFECQDQQSKEMVEKLLSYVKQNQAYPPATFKISDFNLSLKQKSLGNIQTLCHIQWTDIPGEWCDLNNQNFQTALLESHGCCIFVDSDALLNQADYFKVLTNTVQQVEAITSLINQNNLVQYPIALVCTKYDLVESNSIGLIQLEEKLKPLIQKIESSQGITKRFYSAIPLLSMQSGNLDQTTNANDALLWITSELNAIHSSDHPQNLGQVLNSITQTSLTPKEPTPASDTPQQTSPRRAFDLSNPRQVLPIALGGCGILAAAAALFLFVLPNANSPNFSPSTAKRIEGFQEVLKSDPTDASAIDGLVKIYSEELGQEQEAIAFLESLHQQAPNDINILNALAQLHRAKGDIATQEAYYDKILALDNINLNALQGKVQIKVDSGMPDEARAILNQAEKNAKTPAFKSLLRSLSKQIPNNSASKQNPKQ